MNVGDVTGCQAGCQEVSRCRTRGESDTSKQSTLALKPSADTSPEEWVTHQVFKKPPKWFFQYFHQRKSWGHLLFVTLVMLLFWRLFRLRSVVNHRYLILFGAAYSLEAREQSGWTCHKWSRNNKMTVKAANNISSKLIKIRSGKTRILKNINLPEKSREMTDDCGSRRVNFSFEGIY